MSDETIQYITTDYLIEVDGGVSTPAPVEYIVELGQVGVQGIPGEKGEPGFSPTVGYILNDNTFKINITNQDGVTQTPNLYDYFADKNGYLKVDGSNASSNIAINNVFLKSKGTNSGEVSVSNYLYLDGYHVTIGNNSNGISIGNRNNHASIDINTDANESLSIYNGYTTALHDYQGIIKVISPLNNTLQRIATVDQIPTVSDDTITITQGGVTKGTFTLNGSATTIDLDAGGGSITNPLGIGYTQGGYSYSLNLGVNEGTSKIISNYTIASGGSYFSTPIKLLNDKAAPITLTETVDGLYTIGLAYDNTTIKVNQQTGELYAVGGGGTTYTAGTGIDITGGVISIDTSVVAQLSDIPDVSDFVTNSSLTTTLANYVLSSSLASVATSGSYTDLLNKPTIPTNSDYVDLTSNQTIGGVKTFSSETHHTGVITFDSAMLNPIIRGMSGSSYRNMIYRMGNDSAIIVGNSNDTIDLKGSGTRPTYNSNTLALSSDIPTNSNYVDLTTDQTVGGTKTFSNDQKFGGNIYLNGSSNAQGVVHKVGSTRKELVLRNNSASTVYVGNTSDALNLRGNGARPTYYANSTSKDIAFTDDIPSLTNYVTNTNYATTSVGGVVKVDGSTITIDASGVISATSDSNKADKDLSNLTIVNTQITTTALNPIVNKLTNADITVAPSANIDTAFSIQDVNNIELAKFGGQRFTNGTQTAYIAAGNSISGTREIAFLSAYVDGSGDDHCDASTGVKSSIADWSIPSAIVDVTYNSTNHPAMNGTTFTNNTGYPCYLFVTTGNNHSANCTVYAKNISANVESAGMTNAGIVNSQCIPVANGQSCQFFVYVPSGSVSWTATLHRMRGGI